MDYKDTLHYFKWDTKISQIFYNSCQTLLQISNCQCFQPFFSLYFHIHNTKKSHKIIDLERRFYIHKINSVKTHKYYTSNNFVTCNVYDSLKKHISTQELFCKCIPILDPHYYIMNNYNNHIQRNPFIPSCYNYNTFEKINKINNGAYIDCFFSYICSKLTSKDILPSFPIYYGSINGLKKSYNHEITEDYHYLKDEKWFYKHLGKSFTIDVYESSDSDEDESDEDDSDEDDSENESNEKNIIDNKSSDSNDDDNDSNDSNDDNNDSNDDDNESSSDNDDISDSSDESSIDSLDDNADYIACLKNIPCQMLFIEKLEGTLEDLLLDIKDLDTDIILSCIFQISYALHYLQKHYLFTHNDLHTSNIMYCKTDKEYLYYKFNNKYFKIPTHGYIFKIIDFGRSIFTFHNKLFYNDTFEKYGEAEGQYTCPKMIYPGDEIVKQNIVKPNYHFDLCRLSITILDCIRFEHNVDYKEKQSFVNFIYNMTLTEKDESLFDLKDDFNMYISIAKKSCHCLPSDIIQNFIFKKYQIKKKHFPKKLFYSTKL